MAGQARAKTLWETTGSDDRGLPWATDAKILAAVVVILFGLQAHLAIVMGVNWDEFHFLAQIYAYLRGDLDVAVNAFHVHLFPWIAAIPGGEINQIVAGRLVMLAFEAGTVGFIAAITRRFAGPSAGLAAAAVYLSVANVIGHGASFRTDPPATFLLMAVLWIALCSSLSWRACVLAAAALALAGLITIKSALFAPAIGIALLWRLKAEPKPWLLARRLAVAFAAAAAAFIGLFLWHSMAIVAAEPASSVDLAAGAYRKTVLTQTFFPRAEYLLRSLAGNLAQWILIAAGFCLVIGRAAKRPDRWQALALAALIAPTASVIFYRNAYPYFFAFMLAPAVILAGLAVQRLMDRRLVAGAVLAVITVGSLAAYAGFLRNTQDAQRATVAAVHEIFPKPVPYLERASMIGSFKDVGLFMTTWGMENYRQAGQPIFPPAHPADAPVFVIVGHQAQTNALTGQAPEGRYDFLPPDAAWLRDNFVPHWGPIWVAGKRFGPAATSQVFEIVAPGAYTLEASDTVSLDHRPLTPGAIVRLAAGRHVLGPSQNATTLRWGEHLKKPSAAHISSPLYGNF